jgi:hypothetical protein
MLIAGEWRIGDDGVSRPTIQAKVQDAGGAYHVEFFLIDPGADRTVLSAAALGKLALPSSAPPTGIALQGIGGTSGHILVSTILELTRDGGGPVHVRGQFAAFTDAAATDLCILGRDVLNHFDVILSYRRNEVVLLAPNHHYQVHEK